MNVAKKKVIIKIWSLPSAHPFEISRVVARVLSIGVLSGWAKLFGSLDLYGYVVTSHHKAILCVIIFFILTFTISDFTPGDVISKIGT